MKIFEKWLHEQDKEDTPFFVEITLTYSTKTQEVEELIREISTLQNKIFPPKEGYKNFQIEEQTKKGQLIETHRDTTSGATTLQWRSSL